MFQVKWYNGWQVGGTEARWSHSGVARGQMRGTNGRGG